MGTFVFKWPYPANDVHVTGTFDDWGKSEQLNKVGDHWEKEVQLSSADEKILYKFVVNDEWVVDENAPKEDDGAHNVNNVLLPEHIKRNEAVEPPADYEVTRPLEKSESNIPGAFPETPANEPDTYSVDPIPAAGAKDVQSTVTTSQEDYEKAGEGVASAEPDQTVSVAPIPATGAKDIQSTVTTSQEDYEKAGEGVTAAEPDQTVSVNPIPATGYDNVQDTVTTSKEDYEKGGSLAALGAAGAAGAAVVGGTAAATAFSKPSDDKKNLIPESSLPMDAPKLDSTDAGPFVSSSGPGTTTADLASQVPLEPKREAFVEGDTEASPFVSSSGPGTTTAALASQVPLEQKREAVVEGENEASPFVTSSGPSTTTAALASQVPLEQKRQGMIVDPADAPPADSEVLQEKSAVEKELLGKVPVSEATGEPESAAAEQTSYHGLATSVPETVEESMAKANAAPEAASSAAVVAEKAAVEQELLSEVPKIDQAGEPAPTIAASTSPTAPAATAEGIADTVTNGKTAPDTDTSAATGGISAGALAGGAAVGGAAAAAGAAALATHQKDADAAPATKLAEDKIPGTSSTAAAQVSDGAMTSTSTDKIVKTAAPVDKTEGATTEYAPVKTNLTAPGVPASAAAAVSDGTEDPTLANEPAVKMMAQNEGAILPSTAATTVDPADAAGTKGATAATGAAVATAAATTTKADGTAAAKAPETPKKTAAGAVAGTASSASTPAKPTSTATSSPADADKKKKKNRLSRIWHKIVD